jgi:hypothetical protein
MIHEYEEKILENRGGAGLGVSEMAALKVEHFDGAGGYLHVVNGKRGVNSGPPSYTACPICPGSPA